MNEGGLEKPVEYCVDERKESPSLICCWAREKKRLILWATHCSNGRPQKQEETLFRQSILSQKHTGAKPNFLSRNNQEFDVWKMWILWKKRLWNCEFCEQWDFQNVNFLKNVTLKMWILSILRFWKCEFCEKWDFERCEFCEKWDFEKCEFREKWYFQNANFVRNEIFKMWIFG